MAGSLFKKTITHYWLLDAWIGRDGLPCPEGAPGVRFVKRRRVPKGTPGAVKRQRKSSKWYGRLPGSAKAVPLSTNKVAAQQMLAELVRRHELARAGLGDPFEGHKQRPLADHLADWEKVLRARNNTVDYVRLKVGRARKVLDACRFTLVTDLSASRVESALAEMRQDPRFGTQTSNHYLGAVKQFARWLVKDRRADDDPLAHLEGATYGWTAGTSAGNFPTPNWPTYSRPHATAAASEGWAGPTGRCCTSPRPTPASAPPSWPA